ncbi:integrase family protein [Ensifer sp. Root558]|uniref:tyrosine-type recombinase/integrase n=1 Tax=Ensifer sp. Root558 TaxID=1736558 RepID=UPI000760FE9E|nr:integrase family protein [Ensifer sp. Root558]
MKLTSINIATLPARKLPYPDTHTPGLALYVGAKRRAWQVRFRQGGKQRTEVVGYYIPNAAEGVETMGLAAARERASEIFKRIEAGVAAIPAEVKVEHPKEAMTLGQLFDAYEKFREDKAKGNEKKWKRGMKTLPEAMRTIRRNLADHLDLPAKGFTKEELMMARDVIAKRAPQMSDRFLSYLSPVLEYGRKEGKVASNLVEDILRVGPGLTVRDRTLTDHELVRIWTATSHFNSPEGQNYGRLVRFLMVTAQRLNEGSRLKHGDFLDGHWKQGEDANKSSREHLLKLPKLALAQLGEGAADEFVFPGQRKGRPLGGFSKFKAQLDKLSGVTGWRHHDLRRTASTRMQKSGVAPYIIDAVLNHAIQGAGKHYMHSAMNGPKGEAIEGWAVQLGKILRCREVSSSGV